MTMSNIISGFKCTGVYPVNRNAIIIERQCSTVFDPSSLSRETGLNFIPLYIPARPRKTASCSAYDFSHEELDHFQSCYEEGYDITTKLHYNTWLQRLEGRGRQCRKHQLERQQWLVGCGRQRRKHQLERQQRLEGRSRQRRKHQLERQQRLEGRGRQRRKHHQLERQQRLEGRDRKQLDKLAERMKPVRTFTEPYNTTKSL